MSRPKPRDASEHHGAFGRMRLRHEGVWTRGNGARFHRFEMRDTWSRWPQTALGKIQAHLGEAGYEPGATEESHDANGRVHARTYRFARGDDQVVVQVHVDTYGVHEHLPRERVHTVGHFPYGMAGDDRRPRVTIDQVISAMSWGH